MDNKPVTAIIVGAGHRAFVYSELAKTNPAMQELPAAGTASGTDNLSEALAALCVLGYRQEEVMPILLRQSEILSAEELIRLTLREMGRRSK